MQGYLEAVEKSREVIRRWGRSTVDTGYCYRGVAPATTGTTMAVPLYEKCGPSETCKTVIKKSGSIDSYMRASDFDLFLDSYESS